MAGNNVGPSWIIAFGEYEGGELWYFDPTCVPGDPEYHEVHLTERLKQEPESDSDSDVHESEGDYTCARALAKKPWIIY